MSMFPFKETPNATKMCDNFKKRETYWNPQKLWRFVGVLRVKQLISSDFRVQTPVMVKSMIFAKTKPTPRKTPKRLPYFGTITALVLTYRA